MMQLTIRQSMLTISLRVELGNHSRRIVSERERGRRAMKSRLRKKAMCRRAWVVVMMKIRVKRMIVRKREKAP